LQARLRGEDFEETLFVLHGDAQLRSQGIGQMRRVLITERRLQGIRLRVRRQPQMLLD
jgi:hypothetical protein